jgi:hypothetical protein
MLVGTHMLDYASGSNASSYTSSGTLALTAGKLYIATVFSAKSSGSYTEPTFSHANAGTLTVIGGGKDGVGSAFDQLSSFFLIPGSDVAAGSFTANFGTTMVCVTMSVEEFTGQYSTGTIVQSNPSADPNATQTSAAGSLSSFADPVNNAVFSAIILNGIANSITKDSAPYTQLLNNSSGTSPTRSVSVQYNVGEDTAPGFSWTTAAHWALFAFEIKALVDATSPKPPLIVPNPAAQRAASW